MEKTKPSRLSSLLSVTYGDFTSVFWDITYDSGFSIADLGWQRQTKPSKPNRLKTFSINNITQIKAKQTHAIYQTYYQSFTEVLARILEKFGWIAALCQEIGERLRQKRAGHQGCAISPITDLTPVKR